MMKNEKKYGLPVAVLNTLLDLFKKHALIQEVILFGSRAMGNERPGSDIDLCLVGKALDLTELLAIENEVDDLLLPWKIDLLLYPHIDNPDLLKHVQQKGVRLFSIN